MIVANVHYLGYYRKEKKRPVGRVGGQNLL